MTEATADLTLMEQEMHDCYGSNESQILLVYAAAAYVIEDRDGLDDMLRKKFANLGLRHLPTRYPRPQFPGSGSNLAF